MPRKFTKEDIVETPDGERGIVIEWNEHTRRYVVKFKRTFFRWHKRQYRGKELKKIR